MNQPIDPWHDASHLRYQKFPIESSLRWHWQALGKVGFFFSFKSGNCGSPTVGHREPLAIGPFFPPAFQQLLPGIPRPTIRPYLSNFQNNLFTSSTSQASPSTLLYWSEDTQKVRKPHIPFHPPVLNSCTLQISSFLCTPSYRHTASLCFFIATCANTQP